jgi:hypothetical protein
MASQLHKHRLWDQAAPNYSISTLFLHTLLIGHVLLSSEFLVITGETSRFVISLILACSVGYFFILACLQFRFVELTIFTLIALVLTASTVSYAQTFSRELNLSTLLQWYGVLSFIAFSYFVREGMFESVLRTLFIYCAIYSLLYLLGAYLLSQGTLDAFLDTHLVLPDSERMNRLFLAQFVACFAFMSSMIRIKKQFSIRYLFIAAITLGAIVLSLSRVFIAVVLLVSVAYIIGFRAKLIGFASFALFFAISIYLIYGIVDPHFDPFEFSATDQSALQRDLSFSVMRPFIFKYPILGVGLPNNRDDLSHLLGPDRSPSDLGVVGIWFVFGLIGVFLYIYSAFICCSQKLSNMKLEAGSADALMLTGNCLGLYACISPNIWVGSGSIFFGIAIAARLSRLLTRQQHSFLGDKQLRKSLQAESDTYVS